MRYCWVTSGLSLARWYLGAATVAAVIIGPGVSGTVHAQGVPLPSAASTKPAPPKADHMQVRIVRSAEPGCEPHCAEWIAAQGPIETTTPAEFRSVLAKLGRRKLPILIDSVGGSVDPAMAIARMIRARGLDVAVTRTIVVPCAQLDAECRRLKAAGIDLGRPEARISKCASSCAFILAGGVNRYVGAWTLVGLHEIKTISTFRLVRQHYRIEPRHVWGARIAARKKVIRQETLWSERQEGPADQKTYDKIQKFFAEMGVSDSVMPILRSTPTTSIRWLKLADLKETKLATNFINGEQLLNPSASTATASGRQVDTSGMLPGNKPPAAPAPTPPVAPVAATQISADPPVQSSASSPTAAITTGAITGATTQPATTETGALLPAGRAAATVVPPAQAASPANAAPVEPLKPKVAARAKPKPPARVEAPFTFFPN